MDRHDERVEKQVMASASIMQTYSIRRACGCQRGTSRAYPSYNSAFDEECVLFARPIFGDCSIESFCQTARNPAAAMTNQQAFHNRESTILSKLSS
jgi:hypothetical protein